MSSSLAKTVVPLLALTLAAACNESAEESTDVGSEIDAGTDPDADSFDPVDLPSAGNNSATLPSAASGGAGQRKRLELTSQSLADGLFAGPAFATRPSPGSTFLYYYIRVENLGSLRHCFVQATGMSFFTAASQVLLSDASDYAIGSVGTGNTVSTGTCLAAGEAGYILGIEEMDYDELAAIDLTLEASSFSLGDAAATVRPVAIEPTEVGFQVTAENQGGVTALIGSFTQYAVFDGEGVPLDWGFMSPCLAPVDSLAPGQQLDYCSSEASQGSQVHTWIDFDDLEAQFAAKPGSPAAKVMAARARQRELMRRAR